MDRVAHRNRSAPQPENGGGELLVGTEDDASVARRRVFLVLESERQSVASGLRGQLRPGRRYEDLCLVRMVTRLQRDTLSHAGQPPARPRPSRRGARALEHGIAAWARPWGPSCLVELESDLKKFDEKLRHARRWLPPGFQTAAEGRAAERFANIMATMEGSLKLADLTLPSWASRGALTSGDDSSQRASKAPRGRAAPRRPAHGHPKRRPAAPRNSRPDGPERAVPEGPIDVNQVTYEQLRAMELTITQSRRVLAYRNRVKRFESLDELDAIPGFPKTVRERLKHRLSV